MIRAAGILFRTKDAKVLYLKRAGTGDHAQEWCIPGGKIEDGETAEQAAVRECEEEAGSAPDGQRSLLSRTISGQGPTPVAVPGDAPDTLVVPEEQVDFTTFLQEIDEPFDVVIDDESSGFAWAPVDSPPEPLHPGCAVALRRLAADELGVARMMAVGELTSPQYYENVALFDIRITGTKVAYRNIDKQFVIRSPENCLNPDFLARCNGLPVLWEHPEKRMLDSKEWADRVVGTTFLPYIKGDEVWGIVKIYDDAAIEIMAEGGLSTSPTVNFKDVSVNKKLIDAASGDVILIEGKPSLLDHIAICAKGVWDKGGLPAGVNAKADSEMTEDEKKAKDDAAKADQAKADQARKDEENSVFSKLMAKMDSISSRMDSWEDEKKKADKAKADAEEEEKKREDKAKADKAAKDAEEEKKANEAANEPGAGDPKEVERKAAADKAKKDADEKEEKEKADKAKADSDTARRIKDLEDRLAARNVSDDEHVQITGAQAKADSVFQAFGARAPRPLEGETLLGYRRRLATKLKEHSKVFKGVDLAKAFADSTAFEIAENQIYADALTAARNPVGLPDGELRPIIRDDTGHKITEWAGEPKAWMQHFAPTRLVLSEFSHTRGR